jgi:hypothetical protein
MAGRGQETIQNPCTKWFKWAGSTGQVMHYDKITKQNVEVELPFTFLLLDVLSTIKGYDESAKASIWSNEVRDIKNSILTIKSGSDVIASGTYSVVKDKSVSAGGSYAASCYIAYYDENKKLTIGNMIMTGSSLGGGVHKPSDKTKKDIEIGAWIDFTKNFKADIYKKAIVVTKEERVCTQGATKFFCPKFSVKDVSAETDKAAVELNNELQAYLETYLKIEAKPVEVVAEVSKEEQFESNSQDNPFVEEKKAPIFEDESSELPF